MTECDNCKVEQWIVEDPEEWIAYEFCAKRCMYGAPLKPKDSKSISTKIYDSIPKSKLKLGWTEGKPKDSVRITGPKGGMKDDKNKLQWELLPYDAIEEIVKIMTHGAIKYEPDNWKKVAPERYFGALMRHLVADVKGESFDKDSGFLHLSHATTNIIFLLWLRMKELEK